MKKITLHCCKAAENSVTYEFSVSEGLKKYFAASQLSLTYSINIEQVPQAVLAVPFACNVLPLVWMTGAVLELPQLDQTFYESIPQIKHGYESMYPESQFFGQVHAEQIVSCKKNVKVGTCGMLFSGGLDAVHTLIAHVQEAPILFTVWGSDIRLDDIAGWKIVQRNVQGYANHYGLKSVTVRSSFRAFDREDVLTEDFSGQMGAAWWYGAKHGLALLGHMAPCAYVYGLETVYIASSNCPEDGPVRCASDPRIDNFVRYAGAQVIHDSFECTRQDKIRNVVRYCQKTGKQLPLHVCFHTLPSGNCCHCEKCYRTIAALLAENADPAKFGFADYKKTIPGLQGFLYSGGIQNTPHEWGQIQDRVLENRELLEKTEDWEHIAWLVEADFTRPETWKMPLPYRIRQRLSQYRFYQYMHSIKSKLRGAK